MPINPNRTVNVAVQVLPLVDHPFAVVDRAIEVITASGIQFEVGPMETVLEGRLDDCLAAAKAAHLACFEAGAEQVVTIIKIGDSVRGTTIEEKVAKYREPHDTQ